MINIKPDVVMALKSTGIPVLFFNSPVEARGLPCITYYELDNAPSSFADDTESVSKITIVLDIYSHINGKQSLSEIAHKVNCVLFELGFIRQMAQDIPEPEADVLHKTMRYQLTIYNY